MVLVGSTFTRLHWIAYDLIEEADVYAVDISLVHSGMYRNRRRAPGQENVHGGLLSEGGMSHAENVHGKMSYIGAEPRILV